MGRPFASTEYSGGVQWLPVRVRHYDGVPIDGYAIANVLHAVAALDRERSDYSVFGPARPDRRGPIWALRRAVLRRAAVEGYDIVRPAEYPLFLAVSDRFKRAFEGARCTGYAFAPLGLV